MAAILAGLVASVVVAYATFYDIWEKENFNVGQRGNSAMVGATADPEQDGRENLLEYALGSDPNKGGASDEGMRMETRELGGNDHLQAGKERERGHSVMFAIKNNSPPKRLKLFIFSRGFFTIRYSFQL